MGVPGLWDILRPAGKQRSLTQLAVQDGFERNPGGRRGLRVGIDASIWFYHATYGREGENPELRTLFFRCARLMSRPFLPLFVFDGPRRPELKRKKKISGKDHWMVSGMQEIVEAFGFEWWCAPGEAEAELAYLNRIGVIDAIITDDVDTFVFGATMIMRNPGKMLSGNTSHPIKNTAGKDDGEHTYTYTSSDILELTEVGLTRGGLILIALLRGGDYDTEGIDGFGANIAHALARCGFGDTLVEAVQNLPSSRLPEFLDGWRTEIRAELRSNSRGFLNSKKAKLAKALPDTFPNIEVLRLYTNPETSERKNKRPTFLWDREPDLMKLAALCERKFEWGVCEIIVKRFRTVMWAPIVLRIMRRAVLNTDAAGPSTPRKKRIPADGPEPPSTPSRMITKQFSSLSEADKDDSRRLIVGIRGKREHVSTDGLLEYRLEIAPAQLVRLTEAGIQGHRIPPSQYREDSDEDEDTDGEDEDGRGARRKKGEQKKPPPAPHSHLRVWMPACIVERVEPAMVASYEDRVAQKAREKENKEARKAARLVNGVGTIPKAKGKVSASNSRTKVATIRKATGHEEEEEELSAGEDFSHVFGLPSKGKGKASRTARSWSRVKTTPVFRVHEEEEEEEEEDESESDAFPSEPNPTGSKAPLSEATNIPPSPANRRLKATASLKTGTGSHSTRGHSSLWSFVKSPKGKTILDLLDEHQHTVKARSSTTSALSSQEVPSSSQPVHSFIPRPFPMSLADSDDEAKRCDPDRNAPTSQKGDSRKGIVRHYSNHSSDSDDFLLSLRSSSKKSPRKDKDGSPRDILSVTSKNGSSRDVFTFGSSIGADMLTSGTEKEEESDVNIRPVSPSPARRIPPSPNDVSMEILYPSPIRPRRASASEQVDTQPPLQTKHAVTKIIEISSSSEDEEDMPTRLHLPHKQQRPAKPSDMSNRKAATRVDSFFSVVKPKTAITQKATTKRMHPKAKSSRRLPNYHEDEIIEIL